MNRFIIISTVINTDTQRQPAPPPDLADQSGPWSYVGLYWSRERDSYAHEFSASVSVLEGA